MKPPIEQLQDCVNVQCSDGNWNANDYMHGMANGLILAMAIMKGETPKYLDAPHKETAMEKDNGFVEGYGGIAAMSDS